MRRGAQIGAVVALVSGLAACDRLPGKPTRGEEELLPSDVTSFDVLYGTRCAGCHGNDGRLGAARPMNDALYLAVIPDEELTRIVAHGIDGTLMPAVAISSGGELTHYQVDLIVQGMRKRWGKPDAFRDVDLPTYAVSASLADEASAVSRGAQVYQSACSRCHGVNGTGGSAGSIVDPTYLALVSDQALRSAVIAGRPDLGQPDYRTVNPSGPLSARQIDDIVAWLRSHRREPPPES